MRLLASVRSGRQWRRFIVAIIVVLATILVSTLIPALLVPLVLLAIILLIWERMQLNHAMRDLAARIATGDLDTKLEVQEGAWGTLCHAVNDLLQQQRRQHYVQTLVPTLPSEAITTMLNKQRSPDGVLQSLTVLVVGYTHTSPPGASLTQEHLVALRALSTVAQQQSERHGALLERFGDMLLFAFGAFEERPLNTTLRHALQTAQVLRQTWDDTSPRGPLALSLASGKGLSVALPGLGYTVIGAPIEQALRLQHLAAACPEYALLCSEESYMTLRLLHNAHWLPTDLRLLQPDQPPQVVYALPL